MHDRTKEKDIVYRYIYITVGVCADQNPLCLVWVALLFSPFLPVFTSASAQNVSLLVVVALIDLVLSLRKSVSSVDRFDAICRYVCGVLLFLVSSFVWCILFLFLSLFSLGKGVELGVFYFLASLSIMRLLYFLPLPVLSLWR